VNAGKYALATLTTAAILLGGCAGQTQPAGNDHEVDVPDCDADDRAHNETPDCGFVHEGKFYAWSWVKKGKKTAPRGWKSGPEQKAVRDASTPKATTSRRVPPAAVPAKPAPAAKPTTRRSISKPKAAGKRRP
jgi:hypothetical protein